MQHSVGGPPVGPRLRGSGAPSLLVRPLTRNCSISETRSSVVAALLAGRCGRRLLARRARASSPASTRCDVRVAARVERAQVEIEAGESRRGGEQAREPRAATATPTTYCGTCAHSPAHGSRASPSARCTIVCSPVGPHVAPCAAARAPARANDASPSRAPGPRRRCETSAGIAGDACTPRATPSRSRGVDDRRRDLRPAQRRLGTGHDHDVAAERARTRGDLGPVDDAVPSSAQRATGRVCCKIHEVGEVDASPKLVGVAKLLAQSCARRRRRRGRRRPSPRARRRCTGSCSSGQCSISMATTLVMYGDGRIASAPMRLRIFTEPQQGATYDQLLGVAQLSEALGFDAFFRSDHYQRIGEGSPGPGSTDAWLTLAAIGRETSRIRLGTLVTPVTFRFPGPLAIQVAQADAMSGGRVELGTRRGLVRRRARRVRNPVPADRRALRDARRAARDRDRACGLRRRASVLVRGTTPSIVDSPALPKPAQQPRPPIILGGWGTKRTPRLAARFADEFNLPFAPALILPRGVRPRSCARASGSAAIRRRCGSRRGRGVRRARRGGDRTAAR